jgi:hypothetical protein
MPTTIPISKIRTDGGTQPRTVRRGGQMTNEQRVAVYRELMDGQITQARYQQVLADDADSQVGASEQGSAEAE